LAKNALIDLGFEHRGRLLEIYEVKSSAKRQDLYTAIGQTLVHGTDARCQRAVVLPVGERLRGDLEKALDRLNIEVIRFKLTTSSARILGGE
jgi:hypothetical protein